MRDIFWVDGPLGTVAALLRCDVMSPRTVACSLRMPGRSALYCRRLATSIFCTHLMPDIRCV
jgi:hypothetical protein